MFLRGRRNRREETPSTALVVTERRDRRPVAPSLVGTDLHIVGNVATAGELHVDGRIDGDVEARTLTVALSGHVNGHVHTDELVVYGFLSGSARARRVHLTSGCRVMADITHDILCIDEGALFDGHCQKARIEDDTLDLHDVQDAAE